MKRKEHSVIKHIGTPRHSGRYPWGTSGWGAGKGSPGQRNPDIYSYVDKLKAKGLNDTEIAKSLGMSVTELRNRKTIERAKKRAANTAQAIKLQDKGMSNVAIGKRMGINESSVRALLDPIIKKRTEIITNTINMLKSVLLKKKMVDVGVGAEVGIGISRTKLNAALTALKDEGYPIYTIQTKQLGSVGKMTKIKVLAQPGTTFEEVSKNRDQIKTITDYTENKGRTFLGLQPIQSIDSSRIKIAYKEDGGTLKDGVIELRRGVEDLSLGKARYGQVRIGVDGKYYMKGMALYSDNMPPGIDAIYYTKKKAGTPKEDVFKKMVVGDDGNIDPDNPFGATIKRNGQRGAINLIYEEGDWRAWNRSLSSQVLSKQRPALAQQQLDLDEDMRRFDFDQIMAITNPVVRQNLLNSFASDCDSAAINLQAAALPRQSSHAILPINSLKENEVYAPMFNNGESVVLIRHPHGGIFEIPELTVNNKNLEANSVMKNSQDAIGINSKVASRLSGADFDGDTVIVIPNNKGFIKTAPALKDLKDFDPVESYPWYEGMKVITSEGKQLEMGKVSNLITDMTIQGAGDSEIARAIKHSMVVIDAEKHKLNYRQSYIDNGIPELRAKYQGGANKGAATLISRSKSQVRLNERVEGITIVDPETGKKRKLYVNPQTGEKLYTETGRIIPERKKYKDPNTGLVTYVETGKLVKAQTRSTKMAEAKSAFDLSSGTKMEAIYAEYANSLKQLANKARKAALETPNLKYSPEANKTFSTEVMSLKAKLKEVNRSKPLERQAQLAANKVYREKVLSNPWMDADDKKRLRGQALVEARIRVGSKKPDLDVNEREWHAIQMGALSHNIAAQLIKNMPPDIVKMKAIPRKAYKMTPTKVAKAKAMASAGYTTAEIASALGVSTTTILETVG